jgi:hypothetical protein
MTKNIKNFNTRSWRSLVGAIAIVCSMSVAVVAQTPNNYTLGGTTISNTATSTYADETGTDTFTTTSNTVEVIVSNIAGLAITPDAGNNGAVVRDQTNVNFVFTVYNTGNFTNQVVFKEAGASIIKTGSAAANSTITAAFIDANSNGIFDGADLDIFESDDDVTSADVLKDASFQVVVVLEVLHDALGGNTIDIQLGDAPGTTPWDNKALVASAADVVTAIAGTNGFEEARGNMFVTLSNTGSVLLGTRVLGVNYPGAIGTTDMNDYTNKSVTTGILVAPGEDTNASGVAIFTNSVKNTGNAADTFTFTASGIPTDFTVEINVGAGYVAASTAPTLLIAYDTTATILVKITAPSGIEVLNGYPTTIRATSGTTIAANNETIDRLYTGYLSLSKDQLVSNATSRGVQGTPGEAVPGATILYTVTYDNMASENGGTNSSPLSAGTVVMIDLVPDNTDFDFDSAANTGVAGTFSYSSSTTGTDWSYVPLSDDGVAGSPAGYDRNVKRVRFVLTNPMAPADAVSTIKFNVRIR